MSKLLLLAVAITLLSGVSAIGTPPTIPIAAGGSIGGVDKCASLYHCHQAYVQNGTMVMARGYVTVSAAGSDASYSTEAVYVDSIGDDGVVQAFQAAISIDGWAGNFPCFVPSPNIWQSMSATGQADGLSQIGCTIFSASLQATILSKQSLSAQLNSLPGWAIALIVIACLLFCVCAVMVVWFKAKSF